MQQNTTEHDIIQQNVHNMTQYRPISHTTHNMMYVACFFLLGPAIGLLEPKLPIHVEETILCAVFPCCCNLIHLSSFAATQYLGFVRGAAPRFTNWNELLGRAGRGRRAHIQHKRTHDSMGPSNYMV